MAHVLMFTVLMYAGNSYEENKFKRFTYILQIFLVRFKWYSSKVDFRGNRLYQKCTRCSQVQGRKSRLKLKKNKFLITH